MAVWGAWAGKSSTQKMRLGMDFWYTGDPANGYVTVHKIIYAECYYRIQDTSNNSNVSGTAGGHSGSLSYNFPSNYSVIAVWGQGDENVALQYGAETYVAAGASVSGIDYIGTSYTPSVSAGIYLPAITNTTPAAPTIGTNTRNSDTQNTITWTNNPTQQAPYTYVYVERSVDDGSFSQMVQLAGTTASWADTTTTANHSYKYRVRASNAGGYGSYSATSSTTYNTPAAPSNCVASWTAPLEVTVTWTDGSITETAFEIDRSTNGGSSWTNRGSVGAGVTTYADTVTAGASVLYRVRATRGALVSSYSASSNSLDIPTGVSFTKAHTVVTTGMIVKVRYSVGYLTPPTYHANVKVYHGTIAGELLIDTTLAPDTDLELGHEVTAGNTVTMVVTTVHPIVNNAWTADFYEAVDDNTWTFLGYADDQLVGMTANDQLWTGALGSFELANALLLSTPADLVFANLTAVGALSISATETATETFRMSLCHTVLNKFGPTLPSNPLTFWASKPTIEWTAASYVRIEAEVLNQVGIEAVELYFTEDEYQEFAFLGRVNVDEIEHVHITSSSVANPTTITATAHGLQSNDVVTIADHTGSTPTINGSRTVTRTGDNTFTIPVNVTVGGTGGTLIRQTKDWAYNWTGYQADMTSWMVANLTVPTQNYTGGVPASQMAAIDGRLYFWDGDPEYRIWIGGNPGNRFSVSPGTGGGFVDVDPGTGTAVKKVLKFKTQQGAAIVTALCDNLNSQREHRYNLVETNISLSNEQSSNTWQAEKVAGTVGCKSVNGAVAAGDGLYAVSRYGLALTTLTMEYNSQLQVAYVSDPIAPVFLKQYGEQLSASVLFEVNGILYMTFGTGDGSLDNVIFCYDIALKAWWTYTLSINTPILNMISIDYEGYREGIGIITEDAVFLLPTTIGDDLTTPTDSILIESGELSTMQPLQAMHHLAQLEFRFDYFIGDLEVFVTMIDQFGRTITTHKLISHDTLQHQLSEYVRIDAVIESYKVVLTGQARMRMTHFLAKVYPKSNRIGMVYGFDSRQSHSSSGSIHRTFASYNDLREAIIP